MNGARLSILIAIALVPLALIASGPWSLSAQATDSARRPREWDFARGLIPVLIAVVDSMPYPDTHAVVIRRTAVAPDAAHDVLALERSSATLDLLRGAILTQYVLQEGVGACPKQPGVVRVQAGAASPPSWTSQDVATLGRSLERAMAAPVGPVEGMDRVRRAGVHRIWIRRFFGPEEGMPTGGVPLPRVCPDTSSSQESQDTPFPMNVAPVPDRPEPEPRSRSLQPAAPVAAGTDTSSSRQFPIRPRMEQVKGLSEDSLAALREWAISQALARPSGDTSRLADALRHPFVHGSIVSTPDSVLSDMIALVYSIETVEHERTDARRPRIPAIMDPADSAGTGASARGLLEPSRGACSGRRGAPP